MTFEQARRKLARIAKGEYHALQYELTIPTKKHKMPVEARCAVYIHGGDWFASDTWAGAFALLKAEGDRRKKREADPAEQPQDDR